MQAIECIDTKDCKRYQSMDCTHSHKNVNSYKLEELVDQLAYELQPHSKEHHGHPWQWPNKPLHYDNLECSHPNDGINSHPRIQPHAVKTLFLFVSAHNCQQNRTSSAWVQCNIYFNKEKIKSIWFWSASEILNWKLSCMSCQLGNFCCPVSCQGFWFPCFCQVCLAVQSCITHCCVTCSTRPIWNTWSNLTAYLLH